MLSETITVKKSCRHFVFMKEWTANNSSVPYSLGKTGCPLCPGILSVLRIASWCARDESKNIQSTEVSPPHSYPVSHDWLSEIRVICTLDFSYVYRETLPDQLIDICPDCKILTVYYPTFLLSTFPSEKSRQTLQCSISIGWIESIPLLLLLAELVALVFSDCGYELTWHKWSLLCLLPLSFVAG